MCVATSHFKPKGSQIIINRKETQTETHKEPLTSSQGRGGEPLKELGGEDGELTTGTAGDGEPRQTMSNSLGTFLGFST